MIENQLLRPVSEAASHALRGALSAWLAFGIAAAAGGSDDCPHHGFGAGGVTAVDQHGRRGSPAHHDTPRSSDHAQSSGTHRHGDAEHPHNGHDVCTCVGHCAFQAAAAASIRAIALVPARAVSANPPPVQSHHGTPQPYVLPFANPPPPA